MMIAGEGVGDAVLLHDDKRDAISQRPVFVRSLGKKLHALIEERLGGGNDRTQRVSPKRLEQAQGGSSGSSGDTILISDGVWGRA